jgi:hypothetical protein
MRHHRSISRRSVLRGVALGGAALAITEAAEATPAVADRRVGNPGVGENIRVSQDSFATHAESALAANPRNPANLLAACIATSSAGDSAIATYASFDGGRTWRGNGALPDSTDGRDPTVAFDSAGRGYVCANTDDVHIWRSSDGGRSFAAAVLATQGQKLDHPWLAADPGCGGSAAILYGAWTTDANTRLEVRRSTDGGDTFEPPRTIATARGPNEAILASPSAAAGRSGTVYVSYGAWPPIVVPPARLRPEIVAPIRVARSADYGQTWGDPVELGNGVMEVRIAPDANSTGLPAIVASPYSPLVAVAFVTRDSGAPYTDVVVRVSRDAGDTWMPPTRVPRAGDDIQYFQPQLAIDPAGRLALSAFAYRQGRVDVMLFEAPPGGGRFGPPVRVTDTSFDPTLGGEGGGKHGAWWIGDYQGLAATARGFQPFWSDTRTGRLEVFTATVRAAGDRAGQA